MDSLWGDDFTIPETPKKTKTVIDKVKNPKKVEISASDNIKKVAKSKDIPIEDKIRIITEKVNQTLGTYSLNTTVIYTKEDLNKYIDEAVKNGIIAIDTETNNSLDPITCKLMGACIYTPNQKAAYIPVNHIDIKTNERLENQVREKDIKEAFDRLDNTKIIMHNGKFDYQVIKCTTGKILSIYWDTMIGAKVLDENERSAGLKQQYIDKIDSSIEKYSIDGLFEDMPYEVFDPELFALYAATDAYMTYKLYLYQKEKFDLEENKDIKHLFDTIEMPIVEVIAEMELTGMEVDQEYGQLLSAKYHKLLDEVDIEINKELEQYKDKIAAWRLTEDANYKPPKTRGEGLAKSKNEQLSDPINLASPMQLAIFFYDILQVKPVNREKPRATGEAEMKEIAEQSNLDICKLILKRREIVKLLTTYIDAIPELAKRWPDGRVRTHFNQYGAATGRLSSSDPINFQNIPAHNKEIRMLFKSKTENKTLYTDIDEYQVAYCDEVETPNGWIRAENLNVNDLILVDNTSTAITNLIRKDDNIYIHI